MSKDLAALHNDEASFNLFVLVIDSSRGEEDARPDDVLVPNRIYEFAGIGICMVEGFIWLRLFCICTQLCKGLVRLHLLLFSPSLQGYIFLDWA